jgi:SNF2 family DNA or RNA helicase
VGYKNLDTLKKSISDISFIVKKEDCLDLPEKTFLNYYVDLTEEQASMYEQLKKKSMAELKGVMEQGNSLVTVKLAITKMLRLHQLVCGHIKDDTGAVHDVESNRLKALDSVLEETSGRVVIWTSFTYDVEQIYKHISSKYGKESVLTYYGATNQEERERVKLVFKRGREDEKIKYLIANDKTGGYGNNFTAINTSIYYSYDFDNNVHHQTQDRIHRIGQIEPVTYVYLIARGTIDEKIISVLKGKMKLADLLTPSNWRSSFD